MHKYILLPCTTWSSKSCSRIHQSIWHINFFNTLISFLLSMYESKKTTLPFTTSSHLSSFSLKIIHFDIWGPTPILLNQSFFYYIVFIDDFGKFTWVLISFVDSKDISNDTLVIKYSPFTPSAGGGGGNIMHLIIIWTLLTSFIESHILTLMNKMTP